MQTAPGKPDAIRRHGAVRRTAAPTVGSSSPPASSTFHSLVPHNLVLHNFVLLSLVLVCIVAANAAGADPTDPCTDSRHDAAGYVIGEVLSVTSRTDDPTEGCRSEIRLTVLESSENESEVSVFTPGGMCGDRLARVFGGPGGGSRSFAVGELAIVAFGTSNTEERWVVEKGTCHSLCCGVDPDSYETFVANAFSQGVADSTVAVFRGFSSSVFAHPVTPDNTGEKAWPLFQVDLDGHYESVPEFLSRHQLLPPAD